MARISVAELYELMEAGEQPIVVDVRSSTARTLEPRWIPGAIHVPVDDVGRHVAELPRDREDRRLLHLPERGVGGARRQGCSSITASRRCGPCTAASMRGSQAGYAVDGMQAAPDVSEASAHHW